MSASVVSHYKSTFSCLKSVGKVYMQEGACLCVSSSAQGQNTISSKPPKSLQPLINLKSYHDHSVHMRTMDRILGKQLSPAPPHRQDSNELQPMVPHRTDEHWSRERSLQFWKKKYLFFKSLTSPCINSSRRSGMGFPYSQLSSHLWETLIPCDCLGLGGNNHGSFCATLAMTKHPCLCTVRDPCQPSCRLQLVNSLGARGNTRPPGLKQNNSKKPNTPTK